MDNDNEQFTQEGFELLPEDAKDFLYHGKYDAAIAAVAGEYSLTEQQRKTLSGIVVAYIVGATDFDIMSERLETLAMPPEKTDALAKSIYTQVIVPMIEYVEADMEEAPADKTVPSDEAPSPADVLASLKSRMTAPASIAPSVRQTTPIAEKAPAPAAPAIDPYREMPQ